MIDSAYLLAGFTDKFYFNMFDTSNRYQDSSKYMFEEFPSL